MQLTWDNLPTVVSVVSGVGGIVVALLLYRMRAEFAARGAVDTLGARVDAVETRQSGLSAKLDAVAAEMDQLPTHADIAALRTELAGVRGDVKALSAKLDTGLGGVTDQLRMLVQHHLERTP